MDTWGSREASKGISRGPTGAGGGGTRPNGGRRRMASEPGRPSMRPAFEPRLPCSTLHVLPTHLSGGQLILDVLMLPLHHLQLLRTPRQLRLQQRLRSRQGAAGGRRRGRCGQRAWPRGTQARPAGGGLTWPVRGTTTCARCKRRLASRPAQQCSPRLQPCAAAPASLPKPTAPQPHRPQHTQGMQLHTTPPTHPRVLQPVLKHHPRPQPQVDCLHVLQLAARKHLV